MIDEGRTANLLNSMIVGPAARDDGGSAAALAAVNIIATNEETVTRRIRTPFWAAGTTQTYMSDGQSSGWNPARSRSARRGTVSRTPESVTMARTRQALHANLSNHGSRRHGHEMYRERSLLDTCAHVAPARRMGWEGRRRKARVRSPWRLRQVVRRAVLPGGDPHTLRGQLVYRRATSGRSSWTK